MNKTIVTEMARNWKYFLTGRPLLMNLSMNEDRASLGNEIRTLYNIAHSEPIHLVVSHDGEQIEQYIRQGLLGSSFE
jgi:hypothetical protein